MEKFMICKISPNPSFSKRGIYPLEMRKTQTTHVKVGLLFNFGAERFEFKRRIF